MPDALDLAIASRLEWRRQAEAAEAEVERLQSLLNGRDDFIVKKGLWSEFVDSLNQQETSK